LHFKLTHRLPEKCIVACSGGPDSVAALYWLHKAHKVEEIIHIHHNTGEFADVSQQCVIEHANKLSIPLTLYQIPPRGSDLGIEKANDEERWRDWRYMFFKDHPGDLEIVLGHQLDDCVEEYITCAIKRGYLGTIPYRHGRCIRPFRTCSRTELSKYCLDNHHRAVVDPTNHSRQYLRGKYRTMLMPWIRENLNEGLDSMVRRMIEEGLGDNDVSSRRQTNPNRGANLAAAIEPEDDRRENSGASRRDSE
jgi:tRNA(Ile)-lysidine synthetase-like protein